MTTDDQEIVRLVEQFDAYVLNDEENAYWDAVTFAARWNAGSDARDPDRQDDSDTTERRTARPPRQDGGTQLF